MSIKRRPSGTLSFCDERVNSTLTPRSAPSTAKRTAVAPGSEEAIGIIDGGARGE
jgi:hypothetical protein